MTDLRRRLFSKMVWVPLREHVVQTHEDGSEEIFAAGSVAIYLDKRADAEQLGWSDIGIGHNGGPYAFSDRRYKPCEVFQYHEGEDLGVDLVFDQHIGAGHPAVWHLNQDLVLALGLLQEGDMWVRPQEGYTDVVRQGRDADGRVISIEIRSEFLRDYLAARGLALRLAIYRRRTTLTDNASHIEWPTGGLLEDGDHYRFSTGVYEVDAQGGPYGGGVAVFHAWRTDVDLDEDVPVFGPENNSNTAGSSNHYERTGPKFYRVQSEFWREEWIEPSERSERVRGDTAVETITFAIDASGSRVPATLLRSEDVGRWLWFSPRVVTSLANRRGGGLAWYTRETGAVWCSPDWQTHFGINRVGLINVYAYDIARLPLWQQRIWVGHNVTPDGPVSAELLSSQMQARPAHTIAPEAALPRMLEAIDQAFEAWLGGRLFKEHSATSEILSNVHRFRAFDQEGVLALAKDLARLIADRIDIGVLRKVAVPPKNENWGSLKSLERALATLAGPEEAKAVMGPLAGTYRLRLGDAHLPSSEIEAAFALARIAKTATGFEQGVQLLESNLDALSSIHKIASGVKSHP